MTDWRTVMRQAAERDEQDHLGTDEAAAIRRMVVAAVDTNVRERSQPVWMRRPALVAATIVAIVSVSVGAGLRFDLAGRSRARTADAATSPARIAATDRTLPASPNRQLQFMTAGGTRVIWIFNADLDLEANVQ